MRARIDFSDHTVTVNGETCNFYEAGLYDSKFHEPNTEKEFCEGDFDNFLIEEKGITEIEYLEEGNYEM